MKKIAILFILFFCACSYTPSSSLAKKTLNKKIYLSTSINEQDPRSSVYVVDNIRALLMQKLKLELVAKEEAQDFIKIKVQNIDFLPLIYDENGYVVNYKAVLRLEFKIRHKNKKEESFFTQGSYHFDMSPNTIISDTARFNAIKNASAKAFDEFIALLAIRGLNEE